MDLTEYNIMFVNIKGRCYLQVEKKMNIYKEPLDNTETPVVSKTKEKLTETCAIDMHAISTTMLYTEQMWDIMYRKLASQLY